MVGIDAGGLYGGDTEAIVAQFVAQTGVSFPVGWDDNGSYRRFTSVGGGISPFPVDVVIGRDGKVAYLAAEYDPTALDAAVQRALAAN